MPSPVRQTLRDATADAHARVDAAFAGFDLSHAGGYRRALKAHARIAPALESSLETGCLWSGWSPRGALLGQDLADLGEAPPPHLILPTARSNAAAWARQYVLEGSRLGGKVLASRVPPGLPRRYLAAPQGPGAWRTFQTELEAARLDAAWLDQAVAEARWVFAQFEAAAEAEQARV